MRPTFFLLQCVLACRGLINEGSYCNDIVTKSKTHFVVGCCYPAGYPNVQDICLSDLTQTINGAQVYPAPWLVVFPCTTQASAIAGLQSSVQGSFECDMFSSNSYTLYYEASNANQNIDVQAHYQQDFYFCQPVGTGCVDVEPCPSCPFSMYRAGCGQFPTNVAPNTPVSLATLMQEDVGTCQPCATCGINQQYVGCGFDGVPICTQCNGIHYSSGGYQLCSQCSTCPAGNGLSGCITATQPYCQPCQYNVIGGTYSDGTFPCENCPSNSFTTGSNCICLPNYVFLNGQCSLCPPGTYYYYLFPQPPTYSLTTIVQACEPCPVNYYCAGGTSTQVSCPVGTTCPNPGMSQPQPCPAGSFCPTIGQVTPCPEGAYCPYGSSAPTLCPGYTWGTNTGQATAASACPNTCGLDPGCQPGQYTVFCELYFQGICGNCAASCGAGQYQIGCGGTGVTDDSSCQACAAGTYSTAAGVRQCTACPTGATSSAGSSGCTCNAGYAQTSETSCAACQPNSYSSAGATSCPCNSGFLRQTSLPGSSCTCIGFICNCIPVPSAVTCVPCASCPAAQYRQGCQGVNVGTCVACGSCGNATIFQNCAGTGTTDDHVCTPCPAGLHNTGGYATACTNCSACPAGAYAACDGTTRCVPCAQCNAGKIGFI